MKRICVLVLVVALLVALTATWPTDVVGGWLLASVFVLTATVTEDRCHGTDTK